MRLHTLRTKSETVTAPWASSVIAIETSCWAAASVPPASDGAVAAELVVDGILTFLESFHAIVVCTKNVESLLVVPRPLVVKEHESAVLGLELP